MGFLDEVRQKRKKLADVLSDDDYSGIREIVEELYPDRAHFIYELLQNAEDVGATEASFELTPQCAAFEHNGHPFIEDDVWGITNIGKGTKKDKVDQIGRFGVGFKAVFAYTDTPRIYSKTYSFQISDLVLPAAIEPKPGLGEKTRFEFPFDNPKKDEKTAYEEVEAGLESLSETTLLFLTNLRTITWKIGIKKRGSVLREPHSENHIEVLKEVGDNAVKSSHFLRFSTPIEVEERPQQRVSIAFELDLLANITSFDPHKAIHRQLKILPSAGRVCVFFPAEKEASGLRFHVHAPFVPELSRASVKDTPANIPLFEELARLTAQSLHAIRDLKLLTGEFLAVLPNPEDAVPSRYQPIRAAIIEAMRNEPLTPSYTKDHAAAKFLLQARAPLKELLTPEDLSFLVPWEGQAPNWAIGASQRNSDQDRFLSGLRIPEWDFDELVELLVDNLPASRYRYKDGQLVTGPDETFIKWLRSKPEEWHQQLYSALFKELNDSYELHKLKNLQIVRLSDGRYSTGKGCYFPTEDVDHDDLLPRVARGVYTSGSRKAQQEESRKLLVEIGVGEVGEAEEVERILRQRYRKDAKWPSDKTHKSDLRRFMALTEADLSKRTLFSPYFIFTIEDGRRAQPAAVYLDAPYRTTLLSNYYQLIPVEERKRFPLSSTYIDLGLPLDRLGNFAEAVGAQCHLDTTSTHIAWQSHPESTHLSSGDVEKRNNDSYGRLSQDYDSSGIRTLLKYQDTECATLIWLTMSQHVSKDQLYAKWRRNNRSELKTAYSSLVHALRNAAWVPQAGGLYLTPAQAASAKLPPGFPYDPGWDWIKAIRFGEEERKQSEEFQRRQAYAKDLGFKSEAQLERARRFTELPEAEQERLLAGAEKLPPIELPEKVPTNPEERAKRVMEQARKALHKLSEKRARAVSVGLTEIKGEADTFLKHQYTNRDGQMICQICQAELPFRLDNSNYYFERVEFLEELADRHPQNYLALCPNHSAMFQHANGSRELLLEKFREIVGNELIVILAQVDVRIYFTSTHRDDLKAVLLAALARAPTNETQDEGK